MKRLVGLVLCAFCFFSLIQLLQWALLVKTLDTTQSRQVVLAEKKAALEEQLAHWQHRKTDFMHNQERLAQMKYWQESTEIPFRLMSLIAESVTDRVYLHSLNLSGKQVIVSGYGEDARDVFRFLQALRSHACQCVRQLKMEAVKQTEYSPEDVQTFRLSFVFSTAGKAGQE